METEEYERELLALQTALVESQAWAIETGQKLLVLLEGRDAAGKDGLIKRVTEYLAPRNTRVVALPKPTERENGQWWFQRYVAHLPTAGEWVLFNRSWYNRAGVERVMGFSTPEQQEAFLQTAPDFETMLTGSGIRLVKLWLDISKEEQAERLEERRRDPLKRFKVSALDAMAQEKWDAYTAARDEMLRRTHCEAAPWICVRADSKKRTRLNVIRHILRVVDAPAAARIGKPDPERLFTFDEAALTDGRLHR